MRTPNIINLEILPNAKRVPGPDSQALESFQLMNKLPFSENEGPPLLVDSALHPLLDANTDYWLVATAPQPTEAIWNVNNLPYDYSGGTMAYRHNNNPRETPSINPIPAFAISGSPTPEPATLSLLGIGALGLLISRCRRRLFAPRLISEGSHAIAPARGHEAICPN
jgi:hypothetical protein